MRRWLIPLALGAGLAAAATEAGAQSYSNLLVNANGEAGSMAGWTVEANGGSGWYVGTGYGGALPGSSNAFATSYAWDVRSQTIDLIAAGYSAAQLDEMPTIAVSEWVRSYFKPDLYFINVELQDASHGVVGSWTYGTQGSPKTIDGTWTQVSTNLSGYGAGVRYVLFRDGGKDTDNWGGYYGAAFDGASVTLLVQPVPEPSALLLACLGGIGLLRARRRRAGG